MRRPTYTWYTGASLCETSYPHGTTLDVMEATKTRRKSYTCEFKLEVVAFYTNNTLNQDRRPSCMHRLLILMIIKHIYLIYPG